MLQDSALENRLNAVKEGKPIPSPPKQENNSIFSQGQQQITLKQFFINESYKIFQVMSTSILYGFGLKAIFAADWNFIGLFGVGLITNHLFMNLVNFTLKLFKN